MQYHLVRDPLLHDPALIHNKHPVTEILNKCNIVADKEIRNVHFFFYFRQKVQYLLLNSHIEGRCGFIQNQHFWLNSKSTGNSCALTLAAADFMGITFCEFILQPAQA